MSEPAPGVYGPEQGDTATEDREAFAGYFRFAPAPKGSFDSPTFTVVDDDGMGFALGCLARFHGRFVSISITLLPAPQE